MVQSECLLFLHLSSEAFCCISRTLSSLAGSTNWDLFGISGTGPLAMTTWSMFSFLEVLYGFTYAIMLTMLFPDACLFVS